MRPLPALVLALAALAVTGCEFLATVDRGLLDGGGGHGGGAAGATASSGTGGMGPECLLPLDCPGADTDCTARTCAGGRCGTAFVAMGTPTSVQTSGDCMRAVCDGKGGSELVVDDLDVPVDGNPCTDDTCTHGVLANPPSKAGTPCAVPGGNYCDGAGQCVQCLVTAQCAGGLACVNNVCV